MKKPLIIGVDIGNTSTSIGILRGMKVLAGERLPTQDGNPARISGLMRRLTRRYAYSDAVLCSVVPGLTPVWRRLIRRTLGRSPLVVNDRLAMGIRITYPRPETIGADRLANACAAAALYGTPVIVADFGTALTFDVVLKGEGYVGGIIAPGLPLMTDYLAERTALLPALRLETVPFSRSTRPVGKSTMEAMVIGARIGYRGIVREILDNLKRGLGLNRVHLCATGGYASWALRGLDMPIRIDPGLTLAGLGRIYELNR